MNKHMMLKGYSSQHMANLKTIRGIIHYLEHTKYMKSHVYNNVQKEEVKGEQTATINI